MSLLGSIAKIGRSIIKPVAASFASQVPIIGPSLSSAIYNPSVSSLLPAAMPGGAPLRLPTPAQSTPYPGNIPGGRLLNMLPDIGVPGPGVFSSALPRGAKPMTAGMCPVGYHPNKSPNRVLGMPEHSYCVRNRRTNFANGHAARRSANRVKGSMRLLRKLERSLPHRTVHRRVPSRR